MLTRLAPYTIHHYVQIYVKDLACFFYLLIPFRVTKYVMFS